MTELEAEEQSALSRNALISQESARRAHDQATREMSTLLDLNFNDFVKYHESTVRQKDEELQELRVASESNHALRNDNDHQGKIAAVEKVIRLLHEDQDLRQGRACPGAHPRPPGFRQQSPDAHPPGPSKKTEWTPTRPLGECLSNTPTHPAHGKKTKFGVGARSPLKRHPVARSPVGLEAGVPTSGACRWPLRHNSVIFGDPERYL